MAVNQLDVLCCEITIGDPTPGNPIVIANPITLNEVSQIEINESYKQLIGTATVTFPKGTVYKSTIIDTLTLEGKDATRITTEMMQDGVIIEKRTSGKAMDETSFKIGQRINIKLGYNDVLKTMFDGYITGYNSDGIFELKCENMAYKLKLKQCPKITTPISGVTINQICGDKYKLLEGTGFQLHTDTLASNIQIGQIKTSDNFTVAEILDAWAKRGVYCFLKYDSNSKSAMPAIAIVRPYSNSVKDKTGLIDGAESKPYQIDFRQHVAENGLKLLRTDPKFLAITGTGWGVDEQFFSVTVRLNPEYNPDIKESQKFQIVNATQIGAKQQKNTANKTVSGAETRTKVDLSTYNQFPYHSSTGHITETQLAEETKTYFNNFNMNGITGDLTIFGDFGMPAAVQVELIDDRNPSKNGLYLVEEVTTTFGTSGYRQKLTIPYKIKSNK